MSQLLADPSASPRVGLTFPPPIQRARSSEDFRGVGGGVPEPRAAQPGPSTAAGATPRTPPVSSNATNGAAGGDYNLVSTVPPVLSSFFALSIREPPDGTASATAPQRLSPFLPVAAYLRFLSTPF